MHTSPGLAGWLAGWLAKYAAAFFRISRSIFQVAFSERTPASALSCALTVVRLDVDRDYPPDCDGAYDAGECGEYLTALPPGQNPGKMQAESIRCETQGYYDATEGGSCNLLNG